MSRQQLKQPDEARAALDHGLETVEKNCPSWTEEIWAKPGTMF
jgi:hypothetical protein